mgnify:CR=1 FL=1
MLDKTASERKPFLYGCVAILICIELEILLVAITGVSRDVVRDDEFRIFNLYRLRSYL